MAEVGSGIAVPTNPGFEEARQRLGNAVVPAGSAGIIAPLFALRQVETLGAPTQILGDVVEAVYEEIRLIPMEETGSPAFPASSVHLVRRDPALMHRGRLPAVLMRIEHDPQLRSATIGHLQATLARGELIFASATGIGDGMVLLDPYLAPLFGALTPFIWGFPVVRPAGTIIYSLGTTLSGTTVDPAEPMHLLPSRGADGPSTAPQIPRRSVAAALQWWVRRLDTLLSVLSDPAVHSDAAASYSPSKHLHNLLSADQLFRRVASLQRSHRDTEARRVLMFTVLDTLERLTSRKIVDLCTLSFARRVLAELRAGMSVDVAALLLPAAERAVTALEQMQSGFFLRTQLGAQAIEFMDDAGVSRSFSPEQAVAEYIRVLRNATHGHGTNRQDRRAQTDALLVHHNGNIPHDLALIAYLYLLEVLTKPDMLRRTLYNGGLA